MDLGSIFLVIIVRKYSELNIRKLLILLEFLIRDWELLLVSLYFALFLFYRSFCISDS